jgi:hypothetical protein
MYSPRGFTLWVPTCLQSLLQYEIGKSDRIEADGCNIIVGHGKMYNKIISLNCKIKLLNNKCIPIRIRVEASATLCSVDSGTVQLAVGRPSVVLLTSYI